MNKMGRICIQEINNNFIKHRRLQIHPKNNLLVENVFVKKLNVLKCIVNALRQIFLVQINVHVFLVKTHLSIKKKLLKPKCLFNKKELLDCILVH